MDSTSVIAEDINSTMSKSEFPKKTGLGERLKTAREAMQFTQKEAAARLHLNINIIALIEAEAFMDGPPATFMRGYLRSYARLLDLSENEINLTLKELESSVPSSRATTPIAPHLKPIRHSKRYLHSLTYCILLVLGLFVSIWWWNAHARYVVTDTPLMTEQAVQPAAVIAQPTIVTAPTPSITKKKASPAISHMAIALPEPGSEPNDQTEH